MVGAVEEAEEVEMEDVLVVVEEEEVDMIGRSISDRHLIQ